MTIAATPLSADSSGSPFSTLLAPHLHALPTVLRDHYLVAADAPYRIVLEGTMNSIWHRPAWLWPLFWLLTWVDLLFPETGTRVPATMHVTGLRTANGLAAQSWYRTFAFARLRRFNAIMIYDPDRGCVVEHLGPAHLVQMSWDIRFHPPATIEIVTQGCTLQIGRWHVALPYLLYPSVRAVETALLDHPDHIHIDLAMRHPWLGPIFGYNGTFAVRREPIGAAE